MQQRFQDLALLAASKLAEQNPKISYDFSWKDGTLIINPTEQVEKVSVGLDSVVVTDHGIAGGDPALVSLLENTMIRIADPNDARDIGYAHAMAGRVPLEGANAAYNIGYELARRSRTA